MSSMHFQPPNRESAKNKFITSMSMLLIIISLYATCYMLFFRTVEVDVTKAAEITYRGESGTATLTVSNRSQDYNQRIQEFMDSITYKASDRKNLKNGDTVTITASYDSTLADRYHIDPINVERTITVENLPIRYEHADEIEDGYLKKMDERGQQYLDKNMESILDEDFTAFFITSQPQLVDAKRMYRVFLDSKKTSSKDKVIDIYAIKAKGEVNTSSKEQKLEEKEETIYYMITYNEINTSQKILDENVYGEKLMNKTNTDLSKEENFKKFIQSKYGSVYGIYMMDSANAEKGR